MSFRAELPPPPFFDPGDAEHWDHAARLEQVASHAAAARRDLSPASEDRERVLLLLVDEQRDFCLAEGSLFVAGRDGRGAIEDSARLASFLYRNAANITETVATLDSHLPHQIFFPAFWVDRDGGPVEALREITADQVADGEVRPRPGLAAWICDRDEEWLRRQVEYYCRSLEDRGRYRLYLWPPHCLMGSPGAGLVGVVEEARLFHAWARRAAARVVVKGSHPLTEHYSVLAPEVTTTHDGESLFAETPSTAGGGDLLERLLAADRILVAGQAASHCVKNTLEDLSRVLEEAGSGGHGRVYILSDCMSAVTVRDEGGALVADFVAQAEECFAQCAAAGMHVVRSTVPMKEWP